MSYYVIEAQNAGEYIYELITCEHCKYFIKAEMHEYRYKDSCSHPGGMVRPQPDLAKDLMETIEKRRMYEIDKERRPTN